MKSCWPYYLWLCVLPDDNNGYCLWTVLLLIGKSFNIDKPDAFLKVDAQAAIKLNFMQNKNE